MNSLNVLLLSEGDAETQDSWSGSANSLVKALRARGHSVECGDVSLTGPRRWIAAIRTFSPDRRRWWVRYHLEDVPFRLRSERATQIVSQHRDNADLILQIGATFNLRETGGVPYVLYCDSNIELAVAGQETGYSDAAWLTEDEISGVRERESHVYDSASRILAMSERLRRSFMEGFGISGSRIATIHAGPNFDASRIPEPESTERDGDPTILFVGRQFERKGGDLLLEAFRRVRDQVPDARLVLVGPENVETELNGVRNLGFLDKDTQEGWEALRAAYREADVFCLPTRFEPFGISYLEAMYFSVPCVGPDAWAVPEIIQDGETGFTFPPEDVAALTDRLLHLLREPEMARSMGRAGRERATSHFTWDATADRLLRQIRPVISSRERTEKESS